MFSRLIRIDGLNIWKGLSHVGCKKTAYVEALRVFCGELEKKTQNIIELLYKENWKEYAAEVHAVKGGLAGIGAWETALIASELENACNRASYAFCFEYSPKAVEDMKALALLLKKVVFPPENEQILEEVSFEFLKAKFNELYKACISGDAEAVNKITSELKTKSFGVNEKDQSLNELIKKACMYAENLDYHLVVSELRNQPNLIN